MLSVVVPLIVLFAIVLAPIKPIRKHSIMCALLGAAATAFLMGGVSPVHILPASIDGIERIAWVIGLSIVGSLYAQTQIRLGTIDTVLSMLRASVGKTPRGLVVSILITLVIAGSLLGDAIASCTVIGILVVSALDDLEIEPAKIGTIIMISGILGSLMPPITQGFFLSSTLVGIDVDPVLQKGYFTVGICVIVAIVTVIRFIPASRTKESVPSERSVAQIFHAEWPHLVPLALLVTIIVLRTGFKIEVLKAIDPLLAMFKDIPILRNTFNQSGGSRTIQAIIVAILASYAFPRVRKHGRAVFAEGMTSVKKTVIIQASAGVMLGSFYASGMIEKIVAFTHGLSGEAVKIAGGFMMGLIGMVSGSQTTAQNTIFTFLSQILVDNFNVDPVLTALGGAHIACAAQSLPPANLTALVVAGIVAGVLGREVDPIKVSVYALPITAVMFLIGFVAWFI